MAFAFGTPIPDRINMLQPGHNTGGTVVHDAVSKADFVNQWTIYNSSFDGGANVNTVSLGGLVLAPDGTTTGQKVIEATNNGIHSLQSLFLIAGNQGGPSQGVPLYQGRLATIVQAAGRTRIVLQIGRNTGGTGIGQGVQTVFDLANGVIGVAGINFGGAGDPFNEGYHYKPIADHITALGGGWYLCAMDFVPGRVGIGYFGFICSMLIDNDSGSAPQSTSYTGDGASGVNVWRSSLLPTRAFGLTNQTFFDDFTSLSTIDLTNSKAPGFNWYVDGGFPNFNGYNIVTNPASLSISPASVLKVAAADVGSPTDGFGLNLTISSIAPLVHYPSTGPCIGQVFSLPFLSEIKFSYNYNDPDAAPSTNTSWWTRDVQSLMRPRVNFNPVIIENDWMENFPGGTSPIQPKATLSITYDPVASNLAGLYFTYPIDSYITWSTGLSYNAGSPFIVFYAGSFYHTTGSGFTTPGNPPNVDTTHWTLIAAPTPNLVLDFTALNVWSNLWLPYAGPDDKGVIVTFWNGIVVGGLCYGYDIIPSQGSITFQAGDNLSYPLFFGGGQVGASIDWVSVYQSPGASLATIVEHDRRAVSRKIQFGDQSGVGTGPYASGREAHDGVAGTLTANVGYAGALAIDGSALTPLAQEAPSATATMTSVASSASSVILLIANPNRLGGTIFNESTQVLYLLLTDDFFQGPIAASTTSYTAQVQPGARYEIPFAWGGQISGIWASANGFARITEQT